MTNAPPFELTLMGLDRDNFHRAGRKGYRGPCPRCGGNRHLLVFTDNPFPKWHCECQNCGMKAWADELNSAVKVELTPAEKRIFAEKKAAEQAAADKRRLDKLNEYSVSELLDHLSARMTDEHTAWWEREGVPASWQKFLRLGFDPARPYRGADDELHFSPAYSIPYYRTGFELVTVQYRLFNPPNPTDRYRWEAGLGTGYYMTAPHMPIGDRVIICEGAKKGIVTMVHTPDDITVLAVPSKSDFGGIVPAVKECGRVYVMLDPDAGQRARKLAGEIGPAARVVELPVKVDDGITHFGLTDSLLLEALRYGRPV